MNLLCDMHVHSRNSHDSNSLVEKTAKYCLENGVYAFAVTDHCDIQYYKEHDIPACIEGSVTDAETAKREYDGRVKVLRGIEIGEAIWNKSYTEEILKKFDYDVIIGSVHAVRYNEYTVPYSTIDFSKMTPQSLDEYVKTYFDEVLTMINEVDFDIMAHLTCPLRYIVGKYGINLDLKKYEAQICKILDRVIEKSIAVEINTSELSGNYGSFMPDEWIVSKFKEKGGYIVTLGSDAHVSENVAKDFDKAIDMLEKHGFDGYFYYEGRNKVFVKFDGENKKSSNQ